RVSLQSCWLELGPVHPPVRSRVVYWVRAPGALPSFPTRRSSALMASVTELVKRYYTTVDAGDADATSALFAADASYDRPGIGGRSEEHTSELQSRFDLVCRLLLEKKKPARSPTSAARCRSPRSVP